MTKKLETIISGLDFLDEAPAPEKAAKDTLAPKRAKLIENLDIQIAFSKNPTYQVERTTYVKGVKTLVKRKPRSWVQSERDGKTYFIVKLGRNVLMLGAKPIIAVDSSNFIKTLQNLRNAAAAGELDETITKALEG